MSGYQTTNADGAVKKLAFFIGILLVASFVGFGIGRCTSKPVMVYVPSGASVGDVYVVSTNDAGQRTMVEEGWKDKTARKIGKAIVDGVLECLKW